MNSKALKRERGAILLSVLVIVVILTLGLSAVSNVMLSRLSLAEQSEQLLKDHIVVHSKTQDLIYKLAVHRKTVAGVLAHNETIPRDMFSVAGNEIRVDGHTYSQQVQGQTVFFAIQSSGGLIPINSSDDVYLRKLLNRYALSDIEINRLIESLFDYADADSWVRPAGSELSGYSQIPTLTIESIRPANFLLQHSQQVAQIKNWGTFLASHPEFETFLGMSRVPKMNYNAIPLSLWKVLWPETADSIKARRASGVWFKSLSDVHALLPHLRTMPDEYKLLNSELRFSLSVRTGSVERKVDIKVGRGLQKPFQTYVL